jgi:23S rRNA (adenine2030-N6)-methyltransferase
MLSYQHIYHAGNLADIHKHAFLAWMLAYLTRKDKPLSYIETHAGRGLYHLDATEAVKTQEAAAGVNRILRDGAFPADHPLVRIIDKVRDQHGETAYPGSPMIAAMSLREQDHINLAELHPQEHDALADAMLMFAARVRQQDGYEMAMSLCPPTPRRGLMLIDPSYELAADYKELPRRIAKMHKAWNVGVIALWYPILTSAAHVPMLNALEDAGLAGALRHEVRFPPAREGHRMIGSGMFVVNAPYGLSDEAKRLDRVFADLRK